MTVYKLLRGVQVDVCAKLHKEMPKKFPLKYLGSSSYFLSILWHNLDFLVYSNYRELNTYFY